MRNNLKHHKNLRSPEHKFQKERKSNTDNVQAASVPKRGKLYQPVPCGGGKEQEKSVK